MDDGVRPVANLANAAAYLYARLGNVNWSGFYLLYADQLQLGPFTGKPACVRIPLGKGVCGTAAQQDRVIRVPDVSRFPGHIACDAASRSEIVLPLHGPDGRVMGVLDMDSAAVNRFSPEDEALLKKAVQVIEQAVLRRMGTTWAL